MKNGKEITFANRASIKVDKNHVNGISTSGKIIITPNGFILDDKKELEEYKKNNMQYLYDMLGGEPGDIETYIDETESSVEQFSAEPEE